MWQGFRMSDVETPVLISAHAGTGVSVPEGPGLASPRARNLRSLRTLLPFIKAHGIDAMAAAAFLIISTSATISITYAARLLADRGMGSHSSSEISRYFLVFAGVVLVLAISTAGRFYFITRLGERVVADLRIAVYGHVLTLDQAYFLKTRTGEVLSSLTTDLSIVETMLGSSVSIALRNLLTLVVSLVVLAVVNPRLTGFVVVLAAGILVPLILAGRRVRRLSSQAQESFAQAIGYAGETLDGLDTVQAFGREATAAQRFKLAVDTAYRRSLNRIGARAAMTFLVMVLVAGGIGMVLWRASLAVFVEHSMTAGGLLQFVFLSVLAAGAAGSVSETWGDVQKAAGAMERVTLILAERAQIRAPAKPIRLPTPARGDVEFESVVFSYPGRPDLPALNKFSLKIEAGERVALVGPSGAGKSTVFRLLMRFYDPQAGRVSLDGVDLCEADPAEIRARLALVAQDAPLFSGSAWENLRFGRENATMGELAAAATAAEAMSFLSALPQGVDTPLGERAKSLSGGQRQRLAIARALVRNAPVLLLDEATSALDAENERLVQRALNDAMRGRTTLVIAHRLATVLKADRIIVMDHGQVIDSGTHQDLFARGGLYARLARLQFGLEAA